MGTGNVDVETARELLRLRECSSCERIGALTKKELVLIQVQKRLMFSIADFTVRFLFYGKCKEFNLKFGKLLCPWCSKTFLDRTPNFLQIQVNPSSEMEKKNVIIKQEYMNEVTRQLTDGSKMGIKKELTDIKTEAEGNEYQLNEHHRTYLSEELIKQEKEELNMEHSKKAKVISSPKILQQLVAETYSVKTDIGNESQYRAPPEVSCAGDEHRDIDLIIHMRVHTEENTFICGICKRIFRQKQSLKNHILAKHIGNIPRYCNICGLNFTQNNSAIHMQTNAHEKLFCCGICDKKLKLNKHLTYQLRIFTGDKRFGCDVCYKKFKHGGELANHMRSHTGNKTHCCRICRIKFTNSGYFRDHMQKHTNYQFYCCEYCSKKFTRKTNLICHIRVHMGIKSFCCCVCEKNFTYRSGLTTHMRRHTADKPYSCDICNKKFIQIASLQSHLRVHMGDKL